MRIAPAIQLIAPERQQLKQWARGRRTPARLVLRAKIVLLAAAGHDNHQIAAAVATSRQTMGLWRQRFVTQRALGLAQDAPRGGQPPTAHQTLTVRILKTTTHTKSPGATHWSTRTLARHLRTNPTFVQRVWTAHGLQPHRVRAFKLSQDPHFQEKLQDEVSSKKWTPSPYDLRSGGGGWNNYRDSSIRRSSGSRPCGWSWNSR